MSFVNIHSPLFPKSPSGLRTRTIIRTEKAIASLQMLPRVIAAVCSAIPYRSPPIMAPGMLPKPPNIMMAKALIVGNAPM